MKELTIEEKAKAYDEAIEKARKIHNEHKAQPFNVMLKVFPELKESEDEKSKKWILEYLYDGLRKSDEQFKEQFKCAIAWLEKQDEQKPITIDIDKMVSKYSHTKDGDFGLPVNCQIRAYRQGINDALNLSLGIKKQGEQKPFDYENANIQQKDFAPNTEEMKELLRTEYEKGRADAIAEMQDGIDNCPLECSTNTVITDSKKNQVKPKDYNTFDISFNAKDSELQEASYHIPEGFYVEVKNNKLIIKKDESVLL